MGILLELSPKARSLGFPGGLICKMGLVMIAPLLLSVIRTGCAVKCQGYGLTLSKCSENRACDYFYYYHRGGGEAARQLQARRECLQTGSWKDD